jgi:hypothetical protein
MGHAREALSGDKHVAQLGAQRMIEPAGEIIDSDFVPKAHILTEGNVTGVELPVQRVAAATTRSGSLP